MSRRTELLRSLWRRAAGRTADGASRPTAAFLRRRMLVLPALAVVALALCAAAYSDVHSRTERLRDRSAPALVDLAQARTSLELAQDQAELRLQKARQAGLVELGEKYRTLLTEATQSLHRAAQSRALRKAQEQELRVVSGLVVAYADKIAWADRHRTTPLLRDAGVDYAAEMLGDGGAADSADAKSKAKEAKAKAADKAKTQSTSKTKSTGKAGAAKAKAGAEVESSQEPTAILERLTELEAQLRDGNSDLAAWSPLTLAAAAAAALAAALFAVAVAGTLDFLRHRLRLISVQLAAGAAPVLLVPVLLAVGGTEEHQAQQRVHREVAALEKVAADGRAPRAIETAESRATTLMRDSHAEGWSLTAGIALPAAAVGALGCGVTLFVYSRPYPAARALRKYADA
ncbi:hypothetical protein AB0M39_30880 [Streptomyces sp. NPDC051907]|uniref:hypothetical protein n=1 Tax=Streptomyces sp. NPDC051907 TaxID=3155284 RepID=UPI00342CDC8B